MLFRSEERYNIKVIGEDGRPILPVSHAMVFISQCGVIVRDIIPITVQLGYVKLFKKKTGHRPAPHDALCVTYHFGKNIYRWVMLSYFEYK